MLKVNVERYKYLIKKIAFFLYFLTPTEIKCWVSKCNFVLILTHFLKDIYQELSSFFRGFEVVSNSQAKHFEHLMDRVGYKKCFNM